MNADCGHELTKWNCSSGSWTTQNPPSHSAERSTRVYKPSPWTCADCRKTACDDCQTPWKACQSCSDAICSDCAISGCNRLRWDGRTPHGSKTEYLCRPCALKQATSKGELRAALEQALADVQGSDWLDIIVSELRDAIARAERSL